MRPDIRLFEDDLLDLAENAKCIIEEQQRKTRKIMEDTNQTWKPSFFEVVPHPHMKVDTFKHYHPALDVEKPLLLYRLK